MAESNEHFCNVCEAQHITKQADHWCPECEESLCTDCLKHHNASKYTRSHEVITIDNYRSLLPHVANIVQHCEEHDNRFNLYCSEHECLCCTDCLSQNHSRCSSVLGVDKVVKNAKSSTLLTEIERGLRDIKSNIDRISQEKKQNLSRISTQRSQICDEIKSFRNKINLQLDTMENQLIKDLDAKEKTIKSKIDHLLSKLNEKEKSVQELQESVRTVKQHGTDLQALLMSKSLQKRIETEEIYVKSLFDGTLLKQYELGLIINDHVSEFVLSVKSLGSITCSESSPTVTFHTEKEKEAQIFAFHQPQAHSSKKIDDIDIKLIREFQMTGYQFKNRNIKGCTVSKDGNIIVTDYSNKRLILMNDTGKVQDQISTDPSNPRDVTCIDENRVAVTCNNPCRILLINIKSKTIEKAIERGSNYCYGIQAGKGTLFYYESKIGLQSYNLTTSASDLFVKAETDSTYTRYVAISGKRICITQYENNLVLCYSHTGEKIWEYCDTAILTSPRGVAVDKYSNVYVASYNDKSVVVISSDGKKGRKLITLKNDLRAVNIDKNDSLLVVDESGNGHVYTI